MAPIITVTRRCGSGGSAGAKGAGDSLGGRLIDNELVDEVARRGGLPAEEVAQREERAPGLLERLARTLAVSSPELFITAASVTQVEADEETIAKVTERVIQEAAAHGRAVLVGRGAQALLAQRPAALHVYVIAPREFRVKLAIERLGVDPAKAEKGLDDTDRQRDQYVKANYGRHRQHPPDPQPVFNTGRLRVRSVVDTHCA